MDTEERRLPLSLKWAKAGGWLCGREVHVVE